jgi:F-type H+-transporting ATPase subunit gamma
VAGGQERVLRRRIKTIDSTKKITKAMELIAASRIVRAQQRVAAARPYAERMLEALKHISASGVTFKHRMLEVETTDTIGAVGYIVVTADRGLCGAYNSNVLRATERSMRREAAMGRSAKLYVVGKKGVNYFRFRGHHIERSFLGVTDQPTYEQARQIGEALLDAFEDREIDVVEIAYTQFLSVGSQRVVVRRLVPADVKALTELSDQDGPKGDYEYEPGPLAILDELLPKYVQARIYAALLEASASEHAARQRAMKSATDNAEDLKKTLTRVMNRARQDAITTEIMEIVGGAEALRQAQTGGEDLLGPDLLNRDLLVDQLDRAGEFS